MTNNPPVLPLLYPPPPTALKSFKDFNDSNDPNDPNDLKVLKVLKAPITLIPSFKNNPRRLVKPARTRRNLRQKSYSVLIFF